jgi:hypothetical protein
VQDDDSSPSSFHYENDKNYFLSDLSLEYSNEYMKSFTQQLSSQLDCSRLVSTLRGGVLEHLQSHIDADIILPHGVGDWTTTHHMCNHRTCVSPTPYHPIYFHVETHLAGAVNWRTEDIHINVDTVTQESTILNHSVSPAAAYWICPIPDTRNLHRFNIAMSALPSVQSQCKILGTPYSLSNKCQPPISSLEPLLRAGVCFTLIRQFENELVILPPGVPHWVLTPIGATKISRNWMTPSSLVEAAYKMLHNEIAERDEWISDLCHKPLLFLSHALTRLRDADPLTFKQLSIDRSFCFTLHLILTATTNRKLTQQEKNWSTQLKNIISDFHNMTASPSLSSLLSSSSASSLLESCMYAPELPKILSEEEVAAAKQCEIDAFVEEQLSYLHRELPLEIVRNLPGMKQSKKNPGRKVATDMEWMRRENERRLKESIQAAYSFYSSKENMPESIRIIIEACESSDRSMKD